MGWTSCIIKATNEEVAGPKALFCTEDLRQLVRSDYRDPDAAGTTAEHPAQAVLKSQLPVSLEKVDNGIVLMIDGIIVDQLRHGSY